ncbi:hypothetical protein XENTR_v10007147 [Xenopus tropicalis]|nr:hypothetical protein XENTR_v10007147 [Xenopus tropicalis]
MAGIEHTSTSFKNERGEQNSIHENLIHRGTFTNPRTSEKRPNAFFFAMIGILRLFRNGNEKVATIHESHNGYEKVATIRESRNGYEKVAKNTKKSQNVCFPIRIFPIRIRGLVNQPHRLESFCAESFNTVIPYGADSSTVKVFTTIEFFAVTIAIDIIIIIKFEFPQLKALRLLK